MSEFSAALDEAKRAAAEAGALLRDYYARSGEVRFKGETNLVTDADMASQDLIFGRLSRAFPGHDFLGEEGLERLSGSDFRWVIDPLDGTTNFAHRLPVLLRLDRPRGPRRARLRRRLQPHERRDVCGRAGRRGLPR